MRMAPHDEHDFVDREYEKAQGTAWSEPERLAVDSDASSMATGGSAREQLDAKFGSTQQRLLALKQEQEKLESERIALEELRRRRSEYVRGRDEMIGHLTRGISLLEEAQEDARRNGIAMGESIEDFRNHLDKVSALSESEWEEAHLQRELTRSLTTIENARKEWLIAISRFPILSTKQGEDLKEPQDMTRKGAGGSIHPWTSLSTWQMTRMGLALTWPLVVTLLLTSMVLIALWIRMGQ